MITADTITDEQIRELRAQLGKERLEIIGLLDETYAALFSFAEHSRMSARARCAEILNARKAVTP